MAIRVRLDAELARRGLGVAEFANQVGITPANVAVLKNGRAKAVRFSTLEAICRVLDCQPGDILTYTTDPEDGQGPTGARPQATAQHRRPTPGRHPPP